MDKKFAKVIAFGFIVLAVILRLAPHAPNFAPIAALALFGGVYFEKKWAFIIPVAALFISDGFIGFYSWPIMASVYVSFVLVGFIALMIKKNKKITTVIGATLSSSLLFFVITNFSVWAFGTMYTHTVEGLVSCYVAAIPFFRNTLAGDLFYVGLFFGAYELVLALSTRRSKALQRT